MYETKMKSKPKTIFLLKKERKETQNKEIKIQTKNLRSMILKV